MESSNGSHPPSTLVDHVSSHVRRWPWLTTAQLARNQIVRTGVERAQLSRPSLTCVTHGVAELSRTGSRRRHRRRWPGVSAGLSLCEARPAHAGPHAGPRRSGQPNFDPQWTGGTRSRLPRHPLSNSQPPRLGRPSGRRCATRLRRKPRPGDHSQGIGYCEEDGGGKVDLSRGCGFRGSCFTCRLLI